MNVLIGLISGTATEAANRCDFEELMLMFSLQQGLGLLVTAGAFVAVCVYILRQNRGR